MKSEHVVVEAPFSFAGSAKRLWYVTDNPWVQWLVMVPFILFAWSFIACWYIFFGIWIVPYRLLRRSQRRNKRDQLRHRELLAALQSQK